MYSYIVYTKKGRCSLLFYPCWPFILMPDGLQRQCSRVPRASLSSWSRIPVMLSSSQVSYTCIYQPEPLDHSLEEGSRPYPFKGLFGNTGSVLPPRPSTLLTLLALRYLLFGLCTGGILSSCGATLGTMLICRAFPNVHVVLTSLAAQVTSERVDITEGPRWRSRISLGVREFLGVCGVSRVGVRAVLVVLEESMKDVVESR